MKHWSFFIIFLFSFLVFSSESISAATKEEVPYEINEITINTRKKTLDIKGWGFIINAQNFRNASTHKYSLFLSSKDDTIESSGSLRSISHTETMYLVGSRWCLNNEYQKSAVICNHKYDNIGFEFSIPLSKFKMDKEYLVTLKVEALQAKITKTIPIYFPVKNKLVLKDNQNNYIVDSKLNDLSLKVLYDRVFVRNVPGKTGNIKTNLSCSLNKFLYYKKGSTYNNVFDKRLLNNTTYYKLSAKQLGCLSRMALVGEGNDIYPVWIASNFVDYKGEQLIVKTKYDNEKPEIFIKNHPIIYVDDDIDFKEGVTAYDKEDGEITHKLQIHANNFKNVPGVYNVDFVVYDSDGAKGINSKRITVLRRNYPPVINANDIEVKQYVSFDPYLGVSAFDQDSNEISNRLQTTNNIDINIVANQRQCYTVTDRYNLTTNKCINVNVLALESNFRLLAKSNLFYNESIPLIWRSKLSRLNSEISNEIVYIKRNISK